MENLYCWCQSSCTIIEKVNVANNQPLFCFARLTVCFSGRVSAEQLRGKDEELKRTLEDKARIVAELRVSMSVICILMCSPSAIKFSYCNYCIHHTEHFEFFYLILICTILIVPYWKSYWRHSPRC